MAIKQIKKMTVAAAISLVIAGCNTGILHQMDANQPDPAALRLSQVAESIGKYSNELADIEAAKYKKEHPGSNSPEIKDVPPGMDRVVSLGGDWNGPLDRLVTELASLSGYPAPKTYGTKPSGDVIVSVKTEYRPVIDILHDAATQAGSRASVTVKPNSKSIEIEYAKY